MPRSCGISSTSRRPSMTPPIRAHPRRALKKLQRVLGDFNDAHVQETGCSTAAARVSAAGGPAGALLALGRLAEQSRQRREHLRGEVVDGLARFRASESRQGLPARVQDAGVRRSVLMNVVAIYNMKGGVGKTTTAVNLSYLAAAAGQRTCCGTSTPGGVHLRVPHTAPRRRVRQEEPGERPGTLAQPSRRPTTTTWTCCRRTSPTASSIDCSAPLATPDVC